MKFSRQHELTDVQYWESSQGVIDLSIPENNPVDLWLKDSFDFNNIRDCFEIGCFPGRYLAIFAKHGIEVNGIDFVPETKNLREAFVKNSFKAGDIICSDFLETPVSRKFDCVCSFGFIEHFVHWEEVLVKHLELVKENGYLILECPNFRGIFQRIPRYLFDRKNFHRHNLASMDPDKWCSILRSHDFEILYADYFLGYDLWFEKPCRNKLVLYARDIMTWSLRKLISLYKNQNHRSFSAAIGVIARKKQG